VNRNITRNPGRPKPHIQNVAGLRIGQPFSSTPLGCINMLYCDFLILASIEVLCITLPAVLSLDYSGTSHYPRLPSTRLLLYVV